MKQIDYAVQTGKGLLVLLKYTPVHLYPSDDFPRSDFTLNIQLNEIVVCMSLAYMYYMWLFSPMVTGFFWGKEGFLHYITEKNYITELNYSNNL